MKKKLRFDLVIANCNRCEVFWEALDSLKNFDTSCDRLIFMDCSDRPEDELSKSLEWIKQLKLSGLQFYFFKRRNWNLNHGAQMDYIRLIAENKLQKPKFTYFMQEHYLNTKKLIKGDSLPEGEIIDLDQIEQLFGVDPRRVFFCARNGFRVSATIPDEKRYYNYRGKKDINAIHFKSGKDICFVIDGGNYCVDVAYYLENYRNNKNLYVGGNGCINFCGVWEARLTKILYDQKFTFYEKSRNLKFTTVSELKSVYPDPGRIWGYFYHRPHAYFFYGRDIFSYKFMLRREYLEEIAYFCYFTLTYNRDRRIFCLYPANKQYL